LFEVTAFLSVGLGDALRMVYFGFFDDQAEGDREHQTASGSRRRWERLYSVFSPVLTRVMATI
jgi:hypothetical protein